MKKTLFVFALTFSVMFSSSSYAGWTNIGADELGSTHYIDFERIRKHDGHVYFWRLRDYIKPTPTGNWSAKSYSQIDCKLFRFKRLSVSIHQEPMGGGTGIVHEPSGELKNWIYPSPNSSNEVFLKYACNR